ncbi:MAG: TauD/TfdA family dioxygenase [bacterium]|nr:TauD/TfdA family dioxygenase [bacterium]
MGSSIRIEPAAAGCGAVVHGVDLAKMDDETWGTIHRAFLDHGVIFFRDQDLAPDAHIALARRFGPIVVNKFFPESDVRAEIAEVRKEPEQQTNIGGGWHTDHSYDEVPAKGSILVARELPRQGGDTLFANMHAAYEALSDGLKKTLCTLRSVHSNDHLYGEDGIYHKTDLAGMLQGKDLVGRAVHPGVIRHPETGRPALYVNPGHTRGFEGWTVEESLPLLQFLYSHASSDAFTCRFEWAPGSVAIWDNRSTWHMAMNDYHGERRLLHRITIDGVALEAA